MQARRKHTPAIEAFQIALRADPDDHTSWLRLGEAYSEAGRHAAAIKALDRARELEPTDWLCAFLIGKVQSQMGLYTEAIENFTQVLSLRPTDVGILAALSRTYLDLGFVETAGGFVARAEESFKLCIGTAARSLTENVGFRSMTWKVICDAAFHLSKCSFMDSPGVMDVLSQALALADSKIDGPLSTLMSTRPKLSAHKLARVDVLTVTMMCCNHRISIIPTSDTARAGAWYDLGVAIYTWSTEVHDTQMRGKARDASIACFTLALKDHPSNGTYWNALGCCAFESRPKTAQHSFIKALYVDDKVRYSVHHTHGINNNSVSFVERRHLDEPRLTLSPQRGA